MLGSLQAMSHPTHPDDSKLALVKAATESTKLQLKDTISLVIERGDRIGDLMEKSVGLEESAVEFHEKTRRARREACWKLCTFIFSSPALGTLQSRELTRMIIMIIVLLCKLGRYRLCIALFVGALLAVFAIIIWQWAKN